MEVRISIEDAPKFIAQLVREGVIFKAHQDGSDVIIKFTGGF